MQRAVFIAVLAFLFFMGMMMAFYIRQNIGYFLLSTAFLLVYIVTMFSWIRQRRTAVEFREKGIVFGGRSILWTHMSGIGDGGKLSLLKGESIMLPTSLDRADQLFSAIRTHISDNSPATPEF
jgi:hypothetical protein